jgi:hypothetical protein
MDCFASLAMTVGCLKSEVGVCEAPVGLVRIDSTLVIPPGAGPKSILPAVVMDSGLAAEPVIGPRFARTRWRAPE